MATWPESSPAPNYPLDITPRWHTLVSELDSGNEQRRAKRAFCVYDVVVAYGGALTKAEMDVLWNFFMARQGRYEAFYVYDLADVLGSTTTSHSDQYVGTADGSTTTFDLPGRSTSAHDVYVDGVEEADEDYTILTGGGASSADRVQFDTAPADGGIISVDFTGILRMRVRFELDTGLTRRLFETVYYQAGGIRLRGVRPAAS